jgi:TatD DNase family protein
MESNQFVPNRTFYHDSGIRRLVHLTGRCNLNCLYCPEPADRSKHGEDSPPVSEPSLRELIQSVCGNNPGREVQFGGLGEQTYRLYDILRAGRFLRLKGMRVVLNTNGLADRIHNRSVAPDLEDNVDCVNVNIPAANAEDYERICRPKINNAFESIIEFVKSARDYVPEINLAVPALQPEVDLAGIEKLAKELNIGFQAREKISLC